MNKNGLCGEVGLIIIRFKSVKAFSQISPRRCWVKNPFAGSVPWQRARLPGDRGYDSRECASVSVGWGYIYMHGCVSVCVYVCVHQYARMFVGHWVLANLRVIGARRLTNTYRQTQKPELFLFSFLFFFLFKFQERICVFSKVSYKRMHCSTSFSLWNKMRDYTEDRESKNPKSKQL